MKTSVSDIILITLVVIIVAIIIALVVTQGNTSKSGVSRPVTQGWFNGKWIYTKAPNVLFTSNNGVMLPPPNAPLKFKGLKVTFKKKGANWVATLFENGKKLIATNVKFLPDNKSFSVEGEVYTRA
jgi:hypothetical protein